MAKKRGTGFTEQETLHMLDLIEEILPIGTAEWNSVCTRHTETFPGRDKEGLKRKFGNLHRSRMPTGDAHCPVPVRRAKQILHQIKLKSDLDSSYSDDEEDVELIAFPDLPDTDIANIETEQMSVATATAFSGNNDSRPDIATTTTTTTSSGNNGSRLDFLPSPQLTHKRKKTRPNDDFTIKDFMEWTMMQREVDRRERENEREEERKRLEEYRMKRDMERDEENRRFQQMFLLALTGSTKNDKDNED